jgi:hypothetical protein
MPDTQHPSDDMQPRFPATEPTSIMLLRKETQQTSQVLIQYSKQLSVEADKLSRLSRWLKLASIVLGAVVALKGTFDSYFGASSAISIIGVSIAGALIASIGAIEATFQLEKRAASLNVLASKCLEQYEISANRWRREVGDWEFDPATEDGKIRLHMTQEILQKTIEVIKATRNEAIAMGFNATKVPLSTGGY